jgi:putative DNA primase/helicase
VYIEYQHLKKYPKKDAEVSDSPDTFKDAGYLLNDNDLVVDVDTLTKEQIEKIISLFNIKTQIVWTERGAHFYFKKPTAFKGSKKVCPLGFELEYKHAKNTKSITIKQAGKMRKIDNAGIREELPEIFYSKKRLEPLLGMDEHEGRNNALFAHRMKIHDIPDWQHVLRFINENIFAAPLSEEEFNTISRDGVRIDAKKDNEPEIADFILSKYKAVVYLGALYFLENKRFITDDDKLKRLVFAEVGLQKTRYVDEVIKQMKYRAPLIESGTVFDIRLKNGILRDGRFIEVDYQEFTPYSIDIAYNPEAEPVKIVEEYIEHLTNYDQDYKKRLLEIMAHPLIVNKEFKRMLAKFFIFVGDGGNGKGTLLFIIRKILGYENCSALSIKNMTDERYFTTMQGKLANLGDDVQDEPINGEQMKVIKNISTCDYVATRKLFEQSKDIELTISLIFTSNHVLKSFEKGESYRRRVDWLPMYSKPKKKDKNFINKLTTPEALEYWIRLIVEGYQRLYLNEGFTHSELVQQFNDEYHESNNTVLQFLADYDKDFFLDRRSPEIYEEYSVWAEENGLAIQSKKLFNNSIYDKYGLILDAKKINGKTARVFTEPTPYQKQQLKRQK